MDIKEYISSGIIESYVLGLASPEERAEFEKLCLPYPELVQARNHFELELEKLAQDSAIKPPAELKEKIWNSVKPGGGKLISIQEGQPRRNFNWLSAAAVILFLISGFFAYRFYNENKELKKELNESKQSLATTDERLKTLEKQFRMFGDMNNDNIVEVSLQPTRQGEPATRVYWDSSSSNVYLWVKNMPQLPTDKQYQLWALLDGKPIDLGLFDAPKDNTTVILKMQNTQKADAFAITIEKRGNSGGPKGEMQSQGRLKL